VCATEAGGAPVPLACLPSPKIICHEVTLPVNIEASVKFTLRGSAAEPGATPRMTSGPVSLDGTAGFGFAAGAGFGAGITVVTAG
jgi:hypothetical protein